MRFLRALLFFVIFFGGFLTLFGAEFSDKKHENKSECHIAQDLDKTCEEIAKKLPFKELDPHGKDGILLGSSVLLRSFDKSVVVSDFERISAKPSFNTGLIIGAQIYRESQNTAPSEHRFGLRSTFGLDTGSGAFIQAKTLTPAFKKGEKISISAQEDTHFYYPIVLQARISGLYDFYIDKSFSAGASAGLGYRLQWYIVQNSSKFNDAFGLKRLGAAPRNISDSGIFGFLGLHLYLQKHEIALLYEASEFYFIHNNYDFATDVAKRSTFLASSAWRLEYIYRFSAF
ncbi:MAG: hypothetical protein E7K04_03000 [Helicobacter sp.]|nr:hypothetical protein [Helicobacter sp.]